MSYKRFNGYFKSWMDGLDIGRWVPHQARHSLATSLLRAGARRSHIRRYLGHVSERMAERYIHHRIWSVAFRATDLADAGSEDTEEVEDCA